MKVAIYSRFSTDEQDRTSIHGQVANCEALCQQKGLEVAAYYADEARSGNDNSRPQYQEMLAAMDRSEFDGIVCDETSRITRNQSELYRLLEDLEYRDRFLVSGNGIDTRNESAGITIAVLAAIDAQEGRKIAHRTFRALRERHKAGHSAGGKCFGYTSEQEGDYRKRVIWPEQAAVVQEIFERYAAGESAKVIARDFNERGEPSPGSYWKNVKRRSIGWSHTTLLGSHAKGTGILRNPIYKGEVIWNRRAGKKVPGTGKRKMNNRARADWISHQDESLRIVSDELFDRVQARLRAARARTNPENRMGRPPRYLFSGILKCGSCGGNYSVRNATHYSCSSQANGRDTLCEHRRTIRKDTVEIELLADIKAQLLKPELVKEACAAMRERARQAPKHDKELRDIKKQIDNVVESLATVGQSEALTAKLSALEARRAELTAYRPAEMLTGAEDAWREVVSGLEGLHKNAKPDEVERAREDLKKVLGEITVVEDKNRIVAYPKIGGDPVYMSGSGGRI